MNWYKRADKDFDPNRFFNYLKSKNLSFDFYHGTSSQSLEEIQRSGYIISPLNRESSPALDFTSTNVIWVTPSVEYAEYMATEAAESLGSQPVVLKLNIPIHLLRELRSAIFGESIQNSNAERSSVISHLLLGNYQKGYELAAGMSNEFTDSYYENEIREMAPSNLDTSNTDDIALASILNLFNFDSGMSFITEYTIDNVIPIDRFLVEVIYP
tara:strand:- start:170 stop:808 length:639 start_codon:yes stop_codon:yes gene_type:complete